MKKLFTLIAFSMILSFSVNAQMANGSIAPDWTLTDIDGVEWNLYDILDSGKSVVLDFSATWCGPCWNYHETHALRDLYEMYGPEGTDEMMVFFIEGDGNTTADDLAGTGSSTVGNWLEGRTYPIIDDASITGLYEIGYWPTIYHICQNRIVTETGQAAAAVHYAQNSSCLTPGGTNNAGLLNYVGYEGTFCQETMVTPGTKLQNLGTEVMTSASLELSVNGAVLQTIDWTGSLGTFAHEDVSFDEISITEDADISIQVLSVNGADDEDAEGNGVTASIVAGASADGPMITLEILTDQYGYETYWELTDDANGDVIASGGNQNVGPNGGGAQVANANGTGAYGNNESITEEITLPADGCYSFLIVDDYADGMCCSYGDGYYKMLDGDGNTLFEGGAFPETETASLEGRNTVATDELTSLENFTLSPNPVSDMMKLSFELAEEMPLNVAVYNTLGQNVKTVAAQTFSAGVQTIDVNAKDLTNGVYYIMIQSGSKQISRKFVVNK